MARIKTWLWWITHPRANWDIALGELRWQRTRVKSAYERARYGWAKFDIHAGWDCTVGKSIGEQLVYFADNNIAYPGTEQYSTPEAWSNDLRKYGQALIDVAIDVEMPQIVADYYDGITLEGSCNFGNKTPEVEAAIEAYRAEELRRYEAAKEALHWVAENYMSLWD